MAITHAVTQHNSQWLLAQYTDYSYKPGDLIDVEVTSTHEILRDKALYKEVFPLNALTPTLRHLTDISDLQVAKLLARSGYGKVKSAMPTNLASLIKRYDRLYDFQAIVPQFQYDDILERAVEYSADSDSVAIKYSGDCMIDLRSGRNLPCKIDSVNSNMLTIYVQSKPAAPELFARYLPTNVSNSLTLLAYPASELSSLDGWRFKSVSELTLSLPNLQKFDWTPLGGASIAKLRLDCPRLMSLRGLERVSVNHILLTTVSVSESKPFSFDGLPPGVDRIRFENEPIRKAPINFLSLLLSKNLPNLIDEHYHDNDINAALEAIRSAPRQQRAYVIRQEMFRLSMILPSKWLTLRT